MTTASAESGPQRVGFVIGGAQKAGTTALAWMIVDHPKLTIAMGKEAHWFDDERNFRRGGKPVSTYEQAYFAGAEPGTTLFDATPSYLWWPRAPERIRAYNPAMRWIVLLRDPVDRAYSHWNMMRSRGTEELGFVDALRVEQERMRTADPDQAQRVSYFSRGLYAHQIRRLWSLFPREQTLILRSDRLDDDPAGTVADVLAFVGVEPMDEVEGQRRNVGVYAAPIAPEDRRTVRAMYDDDLRDLEGLLDWDLSDWRS
ncbi:MAG: sulfotransferase [Burkholderiales bacterium]|nr:sulfotransferase [Burkholderiales bacterium]MCE7876084.1 sulfotransferase [Betaproteobacteria bacterium PRO3]